MTEGRVEAGYIAMEEAKVVRARMEAGGPARVHAAMEDDFLSLAEETKEGERAGTVRGRGGSRCG